MELLYEIATTDEQAAAIRHVRREVFEGEWGLKLPHPQSDPTVECLHLLARVGPRGDPAATLSVVATSGSNLHRMYGLNFEPGMRVARYTQLAVVKHYRGLNIPLGMILCAHRSFVRPRGFRYTWLLFDAERAVGSPLRKWFGFAVSAQKYLTEYGVQRVLVRDECSPDSERLYCQAEEYLRCSRGLNANPFKRTSILQGPIPQHEGPLVIMPDQGLVPPACAAVDDRLRTSELLMALDRKPHRSRDEVKAAYRF
jgi:hypothetical protein